MIHSNIFQICKFKFYYFKEQIAIDKMEKLNSLSSILEDISNTSEKIIRKSVPIIKNIFDEKKELMKKLQTESQLTEKEIYEKLNEISLSLVKDAKIIKNEMEEFIDYILGGIEPSLFLTQVWLGDVYDCSGVEALKQLLVDLNSQLENCTIEYIIRGIE